MIVTKQKSLETILNYLKDSKNIFIVGCGECATVCCTGGEEEIKDISKKLKDNGKNISGYKVIQEPCHIPLTAKEFRLQQKEIDDTDAFLVLSCGAGIQSVSEIIKDKDVYPGVDSLFVGTLRRLGNFTQFCSLCGNCVLGETFAVCPMTRCAKSLLNGPCGGVNNGKCEVDENTDCAWILIFERAKKLNQTEKLRSLNLPKKNKIPIANFAVGKKPKANY